MPARGRSAPKSPLRHDWCGRLSYSQVASIPAEDDASEPAGEHGSQHCENAVEKRIVMREAEDRLLEAGFGDRQLCRGLLDENAVLEQKGPRLVRADRHVGC